MLNKIVFILILITVSFTGLFSQSKEDLLEQRDKILKELELSSKLLEETIKKRGTNIESVKLLNSKISSRNKLINSYQNEIILLNNQIEDRNSTIKQLQADLVKQKELYASILQYSYKNYNYYTKAVYLLASKSFNQFYLRNKYLQQLKEAREEKVQIIKKVEAQINVELVLLNEDKIRVTAAIEEIQNENSRLAKEKKQKQGFIAQLSSEERELKKIIEEKRKIEEQIKKEIERLVAQELKKNKYSKLTPEEQLVSDDFIKNKGKLPWPTRQGVITEVFGDHYHPVNHEVKVRNNGIDISTPENTSVRAVFKGVVTTVAKIKGCSNSTIIIRHGGYYTVYHNITNVKVVVGDNIETKTILGIVGTESSGNNYILNFQVWKGIEKLNPQLWISN